jgi:hypothetical protein
VGAGSRGRRQVHGGLGAATGLAGAVGSKHFFVKNILTRMFIDWNSLNLHYY